LVNLALKFFEYLQVDDSPKALSLVTDTLSLFVSDTDYLLQGAAR